MTTVSGNIAGVITPIGGPLKRCCAGGIYDLGKIMKLGSTKKKRKKVGVYELVSIGGSVLIEEKKERKYTVGGKVGVWRTIRGRHYFFPDDKSGIIPPFAGGEK